MTPRAAVFDTIMADYLDRVAGLSDPERVGTALGIRPVFLYADSAA
jgi:hypothetical protein